VPIKPDSVSEPYLPAESPAAVVHWNDVAAVHRVAKQAVPPTKTVELVSA
jgi:hypothetical protein